MDSQLASQQADEKPPKQKEATQNLVLVVDDDRITHGIVAKFLREDDLNIIPARNAEEARTELKSHTPELIICDINMPGEDGLTFCREIRSTPTTADVPIIIFTSKSGSQTMADAFDAGASDFVTKPISKLELQSRALRQIKDSRGRRAAASKITSLHKQNTSKTKFLSVASHDLRNPIASIRGISQFLENERFGTINESQREMVRCIIDASENMLTLVEDLLDVSKIELDHFDLSCEQHSPAELLSQTSKLQQPAAEKKQISLEHEDSSNGAMASLDKRLITRAIENLITNAIKFSPPDTHIQLESRADQSWIYISVKDNGPGIPEGEFDKLFKEFSRTSNMPTGGESTSGIGLFVVKRIVTSHGGDITVKNRPQGGAHFQIKIKRIP